MYIGLDIGTSSVKAVLFSHKGHVIERALKAYSVQGADQTLELDPRQVRDAVFNVLKKIGEGGNEIRAIGISSLGEAAVLQDANDQIIGNSILPGDKRGTREAEFLINDMELIRKSGLPINSTYTLCKLLWIKQHQPEIFSRIYHVMLFGDFIGWCLTGERKIGRSLASRTLAYDINEGKFFSIADGIGISPEWFSQPAEAEECLGTLLPSIAELLKLDKNIRVYVGGHDQPCAAVGSGVLRRGEASDSIGTSECITICLGEEKLNTVTIRNANFACEPFLKKNYYNTMVYTHTAGRFVEWFLKDILQQKNAFERFNKQCKEKPSDVLVLPHLSGSGTPYMDSMSTGAMIGLNLHTNQSDIYQGILESISYEMKQNLQLLKESGIECKRIVAVGGGAKSQTWLQSKADIYQMPIYTMKCEDASALGAAISAAKGLGDYQSMEEAVECMTAYKNVVEPRKALIPLYEEKYEQYLRLYDAVKSVTRGKE